MITLEGLRRRRGGEAWSKASASSEAMGAGERRELGLRRVEKEEDGGKMGIFFCFDGDSG